MLNRTSILFSKIIQPWPTLPCLIVGRFSVLVIRGKFQFWCSYNLKIYSIGYFYQLIFSQVIKISKLTPCQAYFQNLLKYSPNSPPPPPCNYPPPLTIMQGSVLYMILITQKNNTVFSLLIHRHPPLIFVKSSKKVHPFLPCFQINRYIPGMKILYFRSILAYP